MPDPVARLRAREFTLSELVVEAARRCATVAPPADARVTPAADERTLRYYQSTGILDRPLRHDGRQAVYGYRHLLQVVAVKALQSQGLSLAQVAAALRGASTEELERALGGDALRAQPLPTPAPSLAPSSARPLLAFELAPGVVLHVDPALVPDPVALAERLSSTLNPRSQP
jgi:DNA-binding transcriptional MerR regulator